MIQLLSAHLAGVLQYWTMVLLDLNFSPQEEVPPEEKEGTMFNFNQPTLIFASYSK
jgi:hypothetical protein